MTINLFKKEGYNAGNLPAPEDPRCGSLFTWCVASHYLWNNH